MPGLPVNEAYSSRTEPATTTVSPLARRLTHPTRPEERNYRPQSRVLGSLSIKVQPLDYKPIVVAAAIKSDGVALRACLKSQLYAAAREK